MSSNDFTLYLGQNDSATVVLRVDLLAMEPDEGFFLNIIMADSIVGGNDYIFINNIEIIIEDNDSEFFGVLYYKVIVVVYTLYLYRLGLRLGDISHIWACYFVKDRHGIIIIINNLVLTCRTSWVRVPAQFFLGKETALGVLCCFALFV